MVHFTLCSIVLLTIGRFIDAQDMSGMVNVALRKPCNMSSQYVLIGYSNDCSCECAINGNTGTTYDPTNHNCIHTDNNDKAPSWTVDLGQVYFVSSITVYARNYEKQIRMRNVTVMLDQQLVYRFPKEGINLTTDIPLAQKGRFVTVARVDDTRDNDHGNVLLNICEIQIWVQATSEPMASLNVGVVAGISSLPIVIVIVVIIVIVVRRKRTHGTKRNNGLLIEGGNDSHLEVANNLYPETDPPNSVGIREKLSAVPANDFTDKATVLSETQLYSNVGRANSASSGTPSTGKNLRSSDKAPRELIDPASVRHDAGNRENAFGVEDNLDWEEDEEEVYGHADLYACYSTVASSAVDQFQKWLLDRLKKPNVLEKEFQSLPPKNMCAHAVGSDPRNKTKNRFKQLCAYDKNRVVLQRPENDQDTDYINASWIKGLDNDRAFIATQGPRQSCVADLWWMVWQEHVKQIVMLTNLQEGGKDKCEKYWPELGSEETYGHMTVFSQCEEERADFTLRTLTVYLTEFPNSDPPAFTPGTQDRESRRTVYQYHYRAWPDHEVPAAGSLVNFWRYVTTRADVRKPPVIHCSAGVGRTGTYIALDLAINLKSRDRDVNVSDIVLQLRQQRSIMVQTLVQYKFLHEVVLEAYTSRNSRLTAEQLDLRFPTDIDINKPNDAIDKEFKLLQEIKGWAKPNTKTAQLRENKDKNRDTRVLPEDDHLPYLSVHVTGRNQYINAVYLSSFRRGRGLLLTQLPLPHTLVDLWRLVEGCDVTTILSFGSKDDEKTVQSYCTYWPWTSGEKLHVDPYDLTLQSCVKVNSNITDCTVAVENKGKGFSVKIVHYTNWSGEVPGNISDVIYLVNLVRAASEDSQAPVLIQCLDGATRSGLFCILYDVICQMTQDNQVDVFSAVRHVQRVRPRAVVSEKQYRFCYRTGQEIRKEHSVYANT